MFKFFIIIIFHLTAVPAFCQLPVLDWAKNFASPDNNGSGFATTTSIDDNGNVYTAGQFEFTLDFDPGPGEFMMTAAGPFDKAMFISKLDADGNFVWAKQIPNYIEFGRIEIKVDKTGNVYLASDLNVAADVDPGAAVQLMTPIGFRDAFVVKLNTNGELVWAKQFGGPGDTGPQANMIELDRDNNVIIGGRFNNTVDFDPGTNTFTLTSTAHMQAFIVKLTNNGEFIMAKQFGNGAQVYSGCDINDIKCDALGNIILIGAFRDTCDFDPGPAVYHAISSPQSTGDGFICKLDASLNFTWVKTFGQAGGDNYFMTPTGIDIDGMNNIITTGFFIGNFDFDPGPAQYTVFRNPYDSYILKLDSQGNFIWAKIIGHITESDTGHDVVTDAEGSVYCIGSFGTSVDFDPGTGTHIINNPSNGTTLIKLSASGDFLYAAPFIGYNYSRRMIIDAARNIYIAGFMGGINDFDPGAGTYELTSVQRAPFVIKLNRCLNATAATISVSACSSYTLNNKTFDSSGTYTQVIPNAAGCDSVITLQLSIATKFTNQSKAICEGTYFFAGGANQQAAGIYYDTLTAASGCDSIVTTHLSVTPAPLPYLGADRPLCRNTSLSITPGTFSSYRWQDNSNEQTLSISSPGTYWVQVTNEYNCTAADTFIVTGIADGPSDFMKQADSVCSYKPLELLPERSFTNYLWSTGAATQKILVQNPGMYSVQVTDNNGCTGTDSIVVYAKNCLTGIYVPAAFTPDNNSVNDKFKPLLFGKPVHYKLVVYNRWGAVIFQTLDPNKGWDGTFRGVPQEKSAFVWICSYQLEGGPLKNEKGTVLLLR
jgi:gliding motility-associated-like protein